MQAPVKRASACSSRLHNITTSLTRSRYLATVVDGRGSGKHYDAIVVGAGPGGLTCASNLLDQGLSKICIFDPVFNAGRINEKYREVPSNTKAGLFVQWATATDAFNEALQRRRGASDKDDQTFQKLQSRDPGQTCPLSDAIDVAKVLSDGLREDPRVTSVPSMVNRMSQRADGVWSLSDNGSEEITADRVVLTPGAHPRSNPMVDDYPHLTPLPLDVTLSPSKLRETVPAGSKVGVIGSSHSAVLALMNIHGLKDVSIVNFYRAPLLYAEYKDGWILYDNTGLKGTAANWARNVLEADQLPSNIRRVNLKKDGRTEKEIYDSELAGCTHLVSAIGFDTNELPRIVGATETQHSAVLRPQFDPLTGQFRKCNVNGKEYLKGLYGAGIAFPERVTDPAGNVESAVGWFKFMRFVKRVSPDWVAAAER